MIGHLTDESAARIVQAFGCDFLGSQVIQRRDHSTARLFHFRDRETGTSLAAFQDEMSPTIVLHKVEKARMSFAVTAL